MIKIAVRGTGRFREIISAGYSDYAAGPEQTIIEIDDADWKGYRKCDVHWDDELQEIIETPFFDREEWLDTEIRPERDKRLTEIDLVHCNAMEWELMDVNDKQAWRDYKQALRDLPAVADPVKVIWPERPGERHE